MHHLTPSSSSALGIPHMMMENNEEAEEPSVSPKKPKYFNEPSITHQTKAEL